MQNIYIYIQDPGLSDQTFSTLVSILGDINKAVNVQYSAKVMDWIKKYFKFPKVWQTLANQQLRLLKWIASADAVKAHRQDADPQIRASAHEWIRQLTSCMRVNIKPWRTFFFFFSFVVCLFLFVYFVLQMAQKKKK